MTELKGPQQQQAEGELQLNSGRTSMAQVLAPCWNQMHVCNLKFHSYIGDLLYILCRTEGGKNPLFIASGAHVISSS